MQRYCPVADTRTHVKKQKRLKCQYFAILAPISVKKEKILMQLVKNVFFLLLAAAPFMLTAQQTEQRKLYSFNKIKASGSFLTKIQKGDAPGVKIEAEGIEPSKIITDVDNETLSIYIEEGNYRNIKVELTVTYTELRAVAHSGSGKFVCLSPIDSKDFDIGSSGSGGLIAKESIKAGGLHIGISGSGSVNIKELNADNADFGISGSGGLNIEKGNVKRLGVQVAGSGGLRAYGLSADQASLTVAGSGGAEITVNNDITGNIAGSGNVSYKGNPANVSNHTAGSGRMRKM